MTRAAFGCTLITLCGTGDLDCRALLHSKLQNKYETMIKVKDGGWLAL